MLSATDFAAVRQQLYDSFEYNFIRIWAEKVIGEEDKAAWRNFNRWASKRYGAIMSREYTSRVIDNAVSSLLTDGTPEQKEGVFDLIINVHSEMISRIDGVYIAADGDVLFPSDNSKLH